ncbi:TetR family transcriptional regulator, partial [bacterium]|nr:TetR family transcriptional regulator [bacterium]
MPASSAPIAWMNGRFLPAAELSLPVGDAGFVLGATVTEQLRTFRGRLFRPHAHSKRLHESLVITGIDLAQVRNTSGQLLALRIEDVCERVGVTKGSLYWHFNDREGLIREALLEQLYRMADELMATLSEAIDTSASRDEYLVRVLGAFIDPFDPAEVEGRWQRLEMLTISRRDEGLAAMLADVQRRQQRYMTDIMEKARVQGILRADVDPKAMAAALTA